MSQKIKLCVPATQSEWPVVGRDPKTGHILLRKGFLEAVEDASGLARGALTEDMASELLINWYFLRRRAGFPPCPITEEIIIEEMGGPIDIEIEESPADKH